MSFLGYSNNSSLNKMMRTVDDAESDHNVLLDDNGDAFSVDYADADHGGTDNDADADAYADDKPGVKSCSGGVVVAVLGKLAKVNVAVLIMMMMTTVMIMMFMMITRIMIMMLMRFTRMMHMMHMAVE